MPAAAVIVLEKDGFKVRRLPGTRGFIIDPGGTVVPGMRDVNKWFAQQPIGRVRAAVSGAYRGVWRSSIPVKTLAEAVRAPGDTAHATLDGIRGSVAVIFTEYAGLSQYDNDAFWKKLRKALEPHGLYYEWFDGGVATIWPIDPNPDPKAHPAKWPPG